MMSDKIGKALGIIIVSCITALLIAGTVKVIMWIL